MGLEYKIIFENKNKDGYVNLFKKLPSPIKKPELVEIYNYSIEDYGFYFIDHLVDDNISSLAFKVFIDEALCHNNTVNIEEL